MCLRQASPVTAANLIVYTGDHIVAWAGHTQMKLIAESQYDVSREQLTCVTWLCLSTTGQWLSTLRFLSNYFDFCVSFSCWLCQFVSIYHSWITEVILIHLPCAVTTNSAAPHETPFGMTERDPVAAVIERDCIKVLWKRKHWYKMSSPQTWRSCLSAAAVSHLCDFY